jgi:hypothetical protein
MLRPDLIFSYWVFIWYILYELSFIKYNPKLWVIGALIFNLIQSVIMIYYKRFFMVTIFFFVLIIMKVIPLWRLRNTHTRLNDFMFGIIVFIIYNSWLYYNNYNMYKLFETLFYSIKNNNQVTPMMYNINRIIKYLN